MNLYDLMGAVAVGAGRGSHTASHRHTVFLGGVLWCPESWWRGHLLGMRRLTLRARSQSEGVLAVLYVLSFVAVFAATVGVSWGRTFWFQLMTRCVSRYGAAGRCSRAPGPQPRVPARTRPPLVAGPSNPHDLRPGGASS